MPRRREVVVPDLGLDDQPITLSLWLVETGSSVGAGAPLVEILAGSAVIDLAAPADGILLEALAAEDELLKPGQPLAMMECEEDDW